MALWGSLQVKFGLSYIAVIAAVLLLLNTYPLLVSEDLVFRSKEPNMTGSVSVVVYSLAGLNRLNQENVAAAMAVVEETGLSRVLVTDSAGLVLYDTRETGSAVGKYTFYSEIVQALEGYDAFSCSYRDGAFRSRTASPVLYQNRIIGAVYAYEYDTEQAALLEGLQSNLLKLSAGIAAAVVLLSILLSRMLTRKISTLLTAIRKVRDFVTDIGSEAERLSRITEDLLRLTRLDSDLLDAPETVEVAPVLEQVMRMMSLLAQKKGTELTYRMEENCRVSATKGEVHQVIYNLTDNAVKYSGQNGKVRVELRHEDHDVVLTVADNGPGIPEEDLPKVFERFYRVDKARSRAAGGTGLGLSIVQDTVKKRGGTVSAANRAGGGAVFTVRWPEAEGGDHS